MDLTFKHRNNTILNINDAVRLEIRKIYEKIYLYTNEYNVVIEEFKNIFLSLHEEDIKSYNLYVQVMIADTYKKLVHELNQNTLNEEDLMTFNIIECFGIDSNDVLQYITTRSGIFESMIESSIWFDKLNLLGRKTVVQNSREYDNKIMKISPLHMLDVLEYGEKTTVKDFLNYYNETLDLIVSEPHRLIEDIVFHMKHLYVFNKQNYLENLQQMCQVFYKWAQYKNKTGHQQDREKMNYVQLIEYNTIDKLGEISLIDSDFIFQIVDDFCYFASVKMEKINNKYISEDIVDSFIQDKLPKSLKQKVKNKTKNNM